MAVQVLFTGALLHSIGGIELDATLSAEHSRSAQVTQYPVERGAPVADHIQADPDSLRLEGLITNARIGLAGDEQSQVDFAGDAFDLLEEIHRAGEPVTIVSDLLIYPLMAITALNYPRDTQTRDALRFTLTATQVRLAESRTVGIPASAVGAVEAEGDAPGTVAAQAPSQQSSGTKQTAEATPTQEEKASGSLLFEAFG